MSDIYLSITETPTVVTLSQPVIASSVAATVTVGNTVTVALDASSLSALEQVTVTVGAAVSVSNFPASQVVSVSNFPASSSVTIGGFSTSSLPPSTVTVGNTVTINGTVTANVMGYDPANQQYFRLPLSDGGDAVITFDQNGGIVRYSDGIGGTSTVSLGNPFPIRVQNSVTIGSLPAISGTVTIGAIGGAVTIPVRLFAEAEGGSSSGQDTLLNCDGAGQLLINAKAGGASVLGYDGNAFVSVKQVAGSSVTARLQDGSGNNLTSTSIGGVQRLNVSLASAATAGGTLPSFINIHGGTDGSVARTMLLDSSGRTVVTGTLSVSQTGSVTIGSLPNSLSIVNSSSVTKANVQYTAIAGSFNVSDGAPSYTMRPVAVNSSGQIYIDANPAGQSVFSNDGTSHIFVKPTPNTTITIGNTVTVSQSGSVTIGTMPSGALTTRFGSVVTANLAFITSAVTNTARKYLLAQNISAGTVTIGIGFSPTTTQGIQLIAGGGLTFDAFCPTGAVYWLGAVTGAAFTILEG